MYILPRLKLSLTIELFPPFQATASWSTIHIFTSKTQLLQLKFYLCFWQIKRYIHLKYGGDILFKVCFPPILLYLILYIIHLFLLYLYGIYKQTAVQHNGTFVSFVLTYYIILYYELSIY